MALILYCDQRDTPNPNLCSDLEFTLLLSFPGIVAFDNDIVHELMFSDQMRFKRNVCTQFRE